MVVFIAFGHMNINVPYKPPNKKFKPVLTLKVLLISAWKVKQQVRNVKQKPFRFFGFILLMVGSTTFGLMNIKIAYEHTNKKVLNNYGSFLTGFIDIGLESWRLSFCTYIFL